MIQISFSKYESLRSKFDAASQQIVVEVKGEAMHGFQKEFVITDCPAQMTSLSENIEGWDNINAKVKELIEAGEVVDMYIDSL